MKKLIPLLFVVALVACHNNQGNVETQLYTQKEKVYANADKTDKLDITFSVEYITAMPDEDALAAVQDTLMSYLFDAPFDTLAIDEAMEQYISVLADEYKIVNADFSGHFTEDSEESSTFSAEVKLKGEIVSIENDVITYLINHYIYYGGAHGNATLTYLCFNEKTGALLTESDVFKEGYKPQLTKMLVNSLMKDQNVTKVEELEEMAFDVESIEPNGNFFMVEGGINYVFNTYEIAPYSTGAVTIFIPNETLKPILK